jgi:hypothetical protein
VVVVRVEPYLLQTIFFFCWMSATYFQEICVSIIWRQKMFFSMNLYHCTSWRAPRKFWRNLSIWYFDIDAHISSYRRALKWSVITDGVAFLVASHVRGRNNNLSLFLVTGRPSLKKQSPTRPEAKPQYRNSWIDCFHSCINETHNSAIACRNNMRYCHWVTHNNQRVRNHSSGPWCSPAQAWAPKSIVTQE